MFFSSILFYIVRCRKSEVEKTVRTREKIFLALINAMVAHFDDEDIKTNSYYTFINFNMRQDIINRVVDARVNSERRIFLTRIKSLFPNLMNSWRWKKLFLFITFSNLRYYFNGYFKAVHCVCSFIIIFIYIL